MIDKNELNRVVAYWSFWDGIVPHSVPRSVSLPPELSPRIALIVQGVRRCGKSTFLTQLIERYMLEPQRCAFVNFEDPALAQHLESSLLDAIVTLFSEIHPKGALYFFFDEIQVVEGWQRWLRTQLERPTRNYFTISGSNASLLSGEFSTVLTGRHLTITLYPFSFQEAQRALKDIDLAQYLKKGGFPEPLQRQDGSRLLKQYFDDIVERDIRERVGSRSSMPVRQTIQMAYESVGSELSLRRVSGAAGVSVETAGSYLTAAESAYLLLSCPFFAYSLRKRNARNKKYYPIDPGLRRAVVTKTGEDLGKLFENMIFIELARRFSEIFYWRDKGEVDFIVVTRSDPTPIQVSLKTPQDRHYKALEYFYESFPNASEALIITEENLAESLSEIERLSHYSSTQG